MAEVNLTDKKTVGPLFSNDIEVVRMTYDFAEDGGDENNEYLLLEAGADLVILDFYIRGITTFDSAADGVTIDVGISGGDEDVLINGVAEADVAADTIVQPVVVEGTPNVLPMPLRLASGGKIQMTVLGEALTAGKCEFVFVCVNA